VLAAAAVAFAPATVPTPHRAAVAPVMAVRPLKALDDVVVGRAVRLGNHAPALTSLAYFGLVSSTMQMPQMRMPMAATLTAVITRNIGPTTNAQFSALFGTLVTPAAYVFLIWPVIAALQALTLAASFLRPKLANGGPPSSLAALNSLAAGPPLSQTELCSLALANAAATAWLFASSNALPSALPLASVLVLPLVPILAAHPLRLAAPSTALYRPVATLFSSFTTIAACLALTVELQHGGRVAFFAGKAELCGAVFLALVGRLIALPRRSLIRRAVTVFALSGIVSRRLAAPLTPYMLLSPTFVGSLALLAWATLKLLRPEPVTGTAPKGFQWGNTY